MQGSKGKQETKNRKQANKQTNKQTKQNKPKQNKKHQKHHNQAKPLKGGSLDSCCSSGLSKTEAEGQGLTASTRETS